MPAFFCKKLAFFYPKNWLTLFIQTAPNWPKIRKMTMTSQFFDLTSTLNSFDVALFLVNFSYASKFHVNIITASGIMTIFFYKRLTRNPEFGNTPAWVLPNIWRLGRVMDTKFDTKISNRKLHWMLQNSSVTAFTVFELLRENQLGWVKLSPAHAD